MIALHSRGNLSFLGGDVILPITCLKSKGHKYVTKTNYHQIVTETKRCAEKRILKVCHHLSPEWVFSSWVILMVPHLRIATLDRTGLWYLDSLSPVVYISNKSN